MESENVYNRLMEAIKRLPEDFSILEEEVDVELQMKYFEFSKEMKKAINQEEILDQKALLFDKTADIDTKKRLLVQLASVDEVEAYRTIEKYSENPDVELKAWTILALQESRMLIQSSLLDEQQVFISTGLGGKGDKLRYFVVFIGRDEAEFTPVQQSLIKNELEFILKRSGGEMEQVGFMEHFATVTIMLPLKVPVQQVFHSVIDECNQYGDFLKEDIIVTNVKKFNLEEIKDFLTEQENADNNELEEE